MTTPPGGDPLAGDALFADVERYAAFGIHRFGSAGDRRTAGWIGQELARAGLKVEEQRFTVGRQLLLERASVTAAGVTFDAMPQWWPPHDAASLALEAPIARDDEDARGRLALLRLPFDRRAYLSDGHRSAIAAAAAHRPLAVLAEVGNPADDVFVYNAGEDDAAWPVPVVVVPGRQQGRLVDAQLSGAAVRVEVDGAWATDVQGRNIIGRLPRPGAPAVVVSTPLTGWFTCAGERGPGVAIFLALARHLSRVQLPADLTFVATTGHEIGHGGMAAFLAARAPPPDATAAWVHLGASIACHSWTADGARSTEADGQRLLMHSLPAGGLVREAFAGIAAVPTLAGATALGELRDVAAAGYPFFFGVAGLHHFFHTPADLPETTSPAILAPPARAFAAAIAMALAGGTA